MRQSLLSELLVGARLGDDTEARAGVPVVADDLQVAAKPRWPTFTAEYRCRILKEAEASATAGAIGALRWEGLYSSLLTTWRRARGRGELRALAQQERGRNPRRRIHGIGGSPSSSVRSRA